MEGLTYYILLLVYKAYISILHNINTLYDIVQTDIMIYQVIIFTYFLLIQGTICHIKKQVRYYMLLTKPL